MASRSSRTCEDAGATCPRGRARAPGSVRSKGRASSSASRAARAIAREARVEGAPRPRSLNALTLLADRLASRRRARCRMQREDGGELALLAEDLGVLVAERLLGRGRGEASRKLVAELRRALLRCSARRRSASSRRATPLRGLAVRLLLGGASRRQLGDRARTRRDREWRSRRGSCGRGRCSAFFRPPRGASTWCR